jgi:hypothetical protein
VDDSQRVETNEGRPSRGFDAGNMIKDRERHVLTKTYGLLVGAIVRIPDQHDREG